MTLKERETQEELLRLVAEKIEVALNDHAVGLAQAQRSAGSSIATGLNEVARAINNLADAVRDAGTTKPSP